VRFELAAKLVRLRAAATVIGATVLYAHGFRDPLHDKSWAQALRIWGTDRAPNCNGRSSAHENRQAMDVIVLDTTGRPMDRLPAALRRSIQWGGMRLERFGCVPGSFHLELSGEGAERGWRRLRAELERMRNGMDDALRIHEELDEFMQTCEWMRKHASQT